MKDNDQTPDDLAQARKIIAKHNASAAGRAIAQAHATAARKALETLPESRMRGILDELLDFVVTRNH
jgi:geranylgeranyl pyrophosphate synthase